MKTLINILKDDLGFFSNDLRSRLKNGQIKVNGDVVKENLEFDLLEEDGKPNRIDVGDFIFNLLSDPIWAFRLTLFDFESLANSNVNNDLVNFLKNFIIIRTSKKHVFVFELNKPL